MNKNICIVLIIVFVLITLYLLKEPFTTYISSTVPYDYNVINMVKAILKTYNTVNNTKYHFIQLDRVNEEPHLAKTTVRVYVHDLTNNEGRIMIITFTEVNKHIKVESLNFSNAVNMPNNLWTNLNSNNPTQAMMSSELIDGLEGIEQTSIDYKPYKRDGQLLVRNTAEFSNVFNPTDYNDKQIRVINEYAVSFAGIMPHDNPSVARGELEYENAFTKLFAAGNVNDSQGRVVY